MNIDRLKKHLIPSVFPVKPVEFLNHFCGELSNAIKSYQFWREDSFDDGSYLWRPAIEEHDQNHDYDVRSNLAVSMPDTPENQKAYPQTYNQKPGLGFPIARIRAIISLSCEATLNLGFCRYAGKGQGEVSLLRRMWDILRPGDVLLTDRLGSHWTGLLLLKQRGIDSVSRLNKATRKADIRRGKRLGKEDHIARWHKPSSIRSVDWKTYKSLPEWLTIRETRIRVEQSGFRTKTVIVVG